MSKPTHKLVMKLKEGTGYNHVIGVAWPSGTGFSIKLDPGVVISHRDCDDYYIGLFPFEYNHARASEQESDGEIEFG